MGRTEFLNTDCERAVVGTALLQLEERVHSPERGDLSRTLQTHHSLGKGPERHD